MSQSQSFTTTAKARRTALLLGLVAAGFYAAFILTVAFAR